MKKILLATTVLAATAGFASADVSISGKGRMGLAQANVAGKVETQFSSRIRIQFDASGTTDGGLSFGASVRNDQDGVGNTANGNSTVFVSGAFGKLIFGDVAGGASDSLVGQISGVGFTGLGDTNEINYLKGTATAVRYDYSSGALSVALGASQTNAANGADKMSVAVKYDGGTWNVAAGYETVSQSGSGTIEDPDMPTSLVSIKAGMTFGAATVQVKYARDDLKNDAVGASVDFAVSPALTLTAFVTNHTNEAAGTDWASKSVGHVAKGIGATYDLGGGAKVVGGVIDNGTDTLADVGMTLAF